RSEELRAAVPNLNSVDVAPGLSGASLRLPRRESRPDAGPGRRARGGPSARGRSQEGDHPAPKAGAKRSRCRRFAGPGRQRSGSTLTTQTPSPGLLQWLWDAPATARRALFAAWIGWLLDAFD